MPKTGATWPLPTWWSAPKTKVSDIQQLWPTYQAGVAAPAVKDQVQTADTGNKQHFPFANDSARDSGYWPATALSFAPAAAGAAGAAFQNLGN
jgi:hypothetical protein